MFEPWQLLAIEESGLMDTPLSEEIKRLQQEEEEKENLWYVAEKNLRQGVSRAQ